jgi:hypothetical protein
MWSTTCNFLTHLTELLDHLRRQATKKPPVLLPAVLNERTPMRLRSHSGSRRRICPHKRNHHTKHDRIAV